MRGLVILGAVLMGVPPLVARSATIDPVITAYRDYKAAMDRQDGPGAERAAARALAASEARDGDLGLTSVLAMNLAIARMDLNDKAGALGPAKTALRLGLAGDKRVDALMARLIIGDAEISGDPDGDEASLQEALNDADQRPDLNSYSLPAAEDLKAAAVRAQNWPNAIWAARFQRRHTATVQGGDGAARSAPAVALEAPSQYHIIKDADFFSSPTPSDLAATFPPKAMNEDIGGRARLACTVSATGGLEDCVVLSEDPPAFGFGRGALVLSRTYRLKPTDKDGAPTAGRIFMTQIRWKIKG